MNTAVNEFILICSFREHWLVLFALLQASGAALVNDDQRDVSCCSYSIGRVSA